MVYSRLARPLLACKWMGHPMGSVQRMKDTAPPPGSRRRVDAQRNRERVLAAARIHLDAGEVELPMNTIARTAGVGVATAYRHFPNRRLLLEALADAGLVGMVVDIAGVNPGLEPAAAVSAAVLCLVHGHRADPAVAAVLTDSEPESSRAQQLCADVDAAVGRLLDRRDIAAALRAPASPTLLRALAVGVAAAVTGGIGRDQQSALVATVAAGLLQRPAVSRAVRYADVPFDRRYRPMTPAS